MTCFAISKTAANRLPRAVLIGVLAVLLAALPTLAIADDWVASQLRGRVFYYEDGQWLQLERDDVISGTQPVHTTASARVTFTRGNEMIDVGGDSLIQIVDQGGLNTKVNQQFGQVTIEAEHQQVQHFSVETPFLAAVVKGTHFTVTSDETSGHVRVQSGLVEVNDTVHQMRTEIARGQTAYVAPDRTIKITGNGPHAPIKTFDGHVVTEDQSAELVKISASGDAGDVGSGGSASSANNGGNGNSNGNGGSGGGNNGGNGNHGQGNNGNGGSGGASVDVSVGHGGGNGGGAHVNVNAGGGHDDDGDGHGGAGVNVDVGGGGGVNVGVHVGGIGVGLHLGKH